MVRMSVDRASFRPYPATVERLLPVEIGELNRLYQLGFASWLPSTAIADGVYFGLRVNGQLVAAAGTHVVSPTARLAVVGNVLTHVDYRGRGFATAVTGAVTAELLRTCDQVVLNVRSDNPPALNAYRRLGYQESAGDLRDRETRDDAQRKRDLLRRRQIRMAAHEQEPQDVVAVVGFVNTVRESLLGIREVGDQFLLRQRPLARLLAYAVDGRVLADHDEPGGGVARRAVLGPGLQRAQACLLERFLSRIEVAEIA